MTGFAFDGYCYSTTAEALLAFASNFSAKNPFAALDVGQTGVSAPGRGMVYLESLFNPSTLNNDTVEIFLIQTFAECPVVGSLTAPDPQLLNIFTMPLAADMGQMWALGFGLPMFCYLVAWAYGSLINFFDTRH